MAKKKKATAVEDEDDGKYKGHRASSRKGKIRKLFDTKGEDAAFKKGVELDLKENTLRSWFSDWRRQEGIDPPERKKKTKVKTSAKSTKTKKKKKVKEAASASEDSSVKRTKKKKKKKKKVSEAA